MNRDPETLLKQLTARGASSDVRARVLAMVGKELERRPRVHWQRACGLAVAAGLVLGIALNVWLSWRHETRLAQLYGPSPLPATVIDVARAVESVTDRPTAQWLTQRLAAAYRMPVSLREHIQRIERFLRDFETGGKEGPREKI
jgi:hypothetical protein